MRPWHAHLRWAWGAPGKGRVWKGLPGECSWASPPHRAAGAWRQVEEEEEQELALEPGSPGQAGLRRGAARWSPGAVDRGRCEVLSGLDWPPPTRASVWEGRSRQQAGRGSRAAGQLGP